MYYFLSIGVLLHAVSALAQINGTLTSTSSITPPTNPEVQQTDGAILVNSTTPCESLDTGGPEVHQTAGMVVVDNCGHTSTVAVDSPDFPTETSHANALDPGTDLVASLGFGALASILSLFGWVW